jgi:glucose-1-phosphate adenylyltransferase
MVLTQYKSQSLSQYIAQNWRLSSILGEYISIVPAQQRTGQDWYKGSADAIFQNLEILYDDMPDIVVVLGADHVYKMDVSLLINAHIQSKKSLTICGVRQPIELASEFGVINGDGKSNILSFSEKPKNPKGMVENPKYVLASMGNYVFSADKLVKAIIKDSANTKSKHDMGGDIVPYFVNKNDASYYDFENNSIPNERAKTSHYWRDVGSLDSYYSATMDLVAHKPLFDLYNKKWPIYSGVSKALPPAKFVYSNGNGNEPYRSGISEGSYISNGVIVSGGTILNSVISPRCVLHYNALVENSILFNNCHIGRHAKIKNAILDKNVRIGEKIEIGYNKELDKKRGFTITENGITVIRKNTILT